MTDDDSKPLRNDLLGWGTPEPRPDFADRVMDRTRPVARASKRRAWVRWTAPILAGALAGAALTMLVQSPRRTAAEGDAISVMQAGPSAEMVTDPGSRVAWNVDEAGSVRIDVVRGVVWIRVDLDSAGVGLHAGDDEESLPPGSCTRVSVIRSVSGEDVTVDALSCTEYEDARSALESP